MNGESRKPCGVCFKGTHLCKCTIPALCDELEELKTRNWHSIYKRWARARMLEIEKTLDRKTEHGYELPT